VQPGYNAQSIVEGKNKLIVAADVCNQQTDKRLLGAMVEQAIEVKKALGIEEKSDMVADAGYFNETDVLANQQEQAGVTPFRWTGPGLWPGQRPSASLHTQSGIHSSRMNDDGEGYTTPL